MKPLPVRLSLSLLTMFLFSHMSNVVEDYNSSSYLLIFTYSYLVGLTSLS